MSSLFKSIAKIAAPIAGFALGGVPGAALGGSLGGALGGGGLKGALLGGAISGAGAGLFGGGLGTAALGPTSSASSAVTNSMGSTIGNAFGNTLNQTAAGGSGLLGALTRGAGAASSGLRSAANSGLGQALLPQSGTSGGAAPTVASSLGRGALMNTAVNTFGGIQGTQAYKDMARAQQDANDDAIQSIAPFLNTGQAANNRLASLLGLNGESQDEILDGLQSSPGYQFRLEQGQDALNRSLGAQGKLFSGQALKAAQSYGQGLADQTYNDYLKNLAYSSSSGQQAATNVAGLQGISGDIQANKIKGINDTWNKSLSNILVPQQTGGFW